MSFDLFCFAIACCTVVGFQAYIYQISHSFIVGAAPQFNKITSNQQAADFKPTQDSLFPDLICILFENTGCKAECSISAQLFYHDTGIGKCVQNRCQCSVKLKPSLNELWYRNFQKSETSAILLNTIERDQQLASKVLQIVSVPFKTPAEYKHQMKDMLSLDDYKQLLLNRDNPMATIYTDNKIKTAQLEKSFDEIYSSTILPVVDIEFKNRIASALLQFKNQPRILKHLMLQIRRLNNKRSIKQVEDYLRDNNILDPTLSSTVDAGNITHRISSLLINKLVDFNENIHVDYPTINSWKIPDHIAQQIRSLQPPYSKYWIFNDVGIDVTTTSVGDIKLWWHDEKNMIRLRKTPRGNIHQVWNFDGARIVINSFDCGQILEQNWYFGFSSLIYTQDNKLGSSSVEWINKESTDSLKTYQLYMLAWCAEHAILIAPEHCKIFNR